MTDTDYINMKTFEGKPPKPTTPLDKIARMDRVSKLSATLLLVSFIMGMWLGGTLWVIPIIASYMSTCMINSDIRRMKVTLKMNYGTGAEEHF